MMQHEHLLALVTHCYYVGEQEVGFRACERLLGSDLDAALLWQVRTARSWYQRLLAELIPCRAQRLEYPDAPAGWVKFNPTVFDHEGNVFAIVRCSNAAMDPRPIWRSVNHLLRLADDGEVLSYTEIADPDYEMTSYPSVGVQDVRVISTGKPIRLIGAVRNVAPYDSTARMALSILDLATARMNDLVVIDSYWSTDFQKNWMPVEGRAAFVSNVWDAGHTWLVVPNDGPEGDYARLRGKPSPLIARHFRGGSPLIRFQHNGMDGYLCVIHEVGELDPRPAEVIHEGNANRFYDHRFVFFDLDLRLTHLSVPFVFQERRAIEFCTSLVAHGTELIMGFGLRDAEPWILRTAAAAVEGLLIPIGDYPL